jgi:hypothetical protein
MNVLRFDERYRNDETGCKAYNPKVLLKPKLSDFQDFKKPSE